MTDDPEEDLLLESRVESLRREKTDLYEYQEWEPRTLFDRFCVAFDVGSRYLVAAAFLVTASSIVILTTASLLLSPTLGLFLLASLVPASFFVFYIWETDPFDTVSIRLLTVTFLISSLLVAVPLVVNTGTHGFFRRISGGMFLFFFLVVAPVEEAVKWLAVRLHGYTSDAFDSPADGAALGAVAGLGFTAVENAVYISGSGFIGFGGAEQMTIARAGVAPFHVLWSAIAGYYLGLAKLDRQNAGPIIFKGLLIAGLLHGTYNTAVYYLPSIAETVSTELDLQRYPVENVLTGGFLLGYLAIVGYYVTNKLDYYRAIRITHSELLDLREQMRMDDEETDSLLTDNGTGTLSFADEDESYAIPVSYGYGAESRSIYIMLGYAPGSEKRTWVNNTETAALTVYEMYDDHEARSAVARGSLHELDRANYQDALDELSDNAEFTVLHWSGAFLEDTDVRLYELRHDSLTGRKFQHDPTELLERT